MTVVEADVRAALAGVAEPETGRPLVALDLLRRVRTGRSGAVTVEVALLAPEAAADVRAEVSAALARLPGVGRVEVDVVALSERERLALATRLQAEQRPGAPAPRVYAVASGKGGVGKSTIAANLAAALARAGHRVGLLDADVWGASVPQLFGVRRHPVALKGLMLPVRAYGVRLMSVGFLVDDDTPVVWRGPMLHKALQQFLTDVAWGDLDVLLVDLPPGTGDITLSLLELLPEAALVAVTTPQRAAAQVAARVARMALDLRMPVAGVVENMTAAGCATCGAQTPLFGSGGGARLAAGLGAPVLGRVPLDLPLREAGDAGVPVVCGNPTAPSAVELTRIAAALPVVRRSLVGVPLPLSVA